MKTRDIVIAVVIVVIVAIGAYMIGTQSEGESEGTNRQSSAPSSGAGNNHQLTQQAIDYQETIDDLKARIKADPGNADLYAQTGDVYFSHAQTGNVSLSRERFTEAIAYYKKAVELNPKDVDSYNDLGLVFHYIDNSGDAIKYINKGIEADATYQRIWLTKGFILSRGFGDIPGAIEAWQEVVSLNPDNQLGIDAASFLTEMENR